MGTCNDSILVVEAKVEKLVELEKRLEEHDL